MSTFFSDLCQGVAPSALRPFGHFDTMFADDGASVVGKLPSDDEDAEAEATDEAEEEETDAPAKPKKPGQEKKRGRPKKGEAAAKPKGKDKKGSAQEKKPKAVNKSKAKPGQHKGHTPGKGTRYCRGCRKHKPLDNFALNQPTYPALHYITLHYMT